MIHSRFGRALGNSVAFGALCSMGLISTAVATDSKPLVQIPAGEAATTLRLLSEQTGLQILFQPQSVEGHLTRAVWGEIGATTALKQMLQDTGLRVSSVNALTVAVVSDSEDSNVTNERSPGNGQARTAISDSEDALSEVLVQGARSLNADIKRSEDDIQPYVVLDREEVARAGVSNTEELLRQKLGATSQVGSNSQVPGSVLGNFSRVNLRGLGTDETLILINGRRLASYSTNGNANQPDVNSIPLAAIERVEVLPSTASGIFGGGATGGVVNIVLKQDYQGSQVGMAYGNAFGRHAFERRLSANVGHSFFAEKMSIMAGGTYSDGGALRRGDRDFQRRQTELVLQNNPIAYRSGPPALGSTTNIVSTTSALQLKPEYGGAVLPANYTSVPYGYDGISSDSGQALVENAGKLNLDPAQTAQSISPGGATRALLSAPEVKSFYSTLRYKISAKLEAFLDLGLSENAGRSIVNTASTSYTLAANSPANPFVQSIRITAPANGLDSEVVSKLETKRAVAGFVLKLGSSWSFSAEYSWSSSEYSSRSPSSFTPGVSEVSAGDINLLRDINEYPVDFSGYPHGESIFEPVEVTQNNPSMRVGGPIPLLLPGGKPSISASLEHRREILSDAYQVSGTTTTFVPERSQEVSSIYLETHIPIVGQANSVLGVKALELQVAARNDRYKTIGTNSINLSASPIAEIVRSKNKLQSTDPTIGMRYDPIRGFALRASYATGFLPPNVSQLTRSPKATVTVSPLQGVLDRRRGNQVVSGNLEAASGGNPDLLPEQARSWTVGVIIEPEFASGLRISVDRSRIKKKDNISALPFGQQLVDSEALIPGVLVRAPATAQNDPNGYNVGPIVGYDSSFRNFSSVDVTSYDFALSYTWRHERFGKFRLSSRATRMMHFKEQVTPASVLTENVMNLGYLKWVASGELYWEDGYLSAGWSTQYYDSYWINPLHTVNLSQGSATIKSQIYHDIFVAMSGVSDTQKFGERRIGSSSWLDDFSVQFAAKNVLNTIPPIDAASTAGYSLLGDPRMARYLISVQKGF